MKKLILLIAAACAARAQTPSYPTSVVTDNQLRVAQNNVNTTLLVQVGVTDTAFTVASGQVIAVNSLLTFADGSNEIVAVCSVTGNTVTVGKGSCPSSDGRGFDGTTATSHALGTTVSVIVDAWYHNAMRKEVESIETTLGPNLSNVPSVKAPYITVIPFASQAPAGGIVSGNNAVIMTPVPFGVNGTDAHHYLLVSGSPGAAEPCLITGGSGQSGQSSGQIILNCSHTHNAGYTIASATAGIEESIILGVGSSVNFIAVPSGLYNVQANIYIPAGMSGGRLWGPGAFLTVASGFTGEVITGDAGLTTFTLEGLEINVNNVTGVTTVINLSRPENSIQDKVEKVRVDGAPNNSTIINMDGVEDSSIEDSGFFFAAGVTSVTSVSWHVPGGNIRMSGVTTFGPLLLSYQVAALVNCTTGGFALDGADYAASIVGGYMYGNSNGNFYTTSGASVFQELDISGTIVIAQSNAVPAFHGEFEGTTTFHGAFYNQGTTAPALFTSATTGGGSFLLYGGGLYVAGAVQGTPAAGIQIIGINGKGMQAGGINLTPADTGATNALVATTPIPIVIMAGTCLTIPLAHTLQIGANTLNVNGTGVLPIKSHFSPATNIAAGYVVGGVLNTCLDTLGTAWLDMSQ